MTTTRRRSPVRRYPRDLAAGARVYVRLMTARGVKQVPGTITELTQDGGRYRVVVETDKHGTVRTYPAANAKLTLAPRAA